MQPFMGQMGGGYYPTIQGHGVYSNQPYANQYYHGAWNQPAQPRIPFLVTLNLPDLLRLTNYIVSHNPAWPTTPAKIPLDIPKFKCKVGGDPGEHVTAFHLRCSSNFLNDDSVHLRLFQHTLMIHAAKWYIELLGGTYYSFHDLAMTFLNHFQLPMRYDAGTELLSTFQQDTSTIIFVIFESGIEGRG